MKKKSSMALTVAALALTAFAATVYRIEKEGDITLLVGADGVKRECVILSVEEYRQLSKMWNALHKSESDRVKLHGAITNTTVSTETRIKRTKNADGYTHEQSMQPVRRASIAPKITLSANANTNKPANMSARQWAMQKRIDEIRRGATNQVTVIHNAGTQKDEVRND